MKTHPKTRTVVATWTALCGLAFLVGGLPANAQVSIWAGGSANFTNLTKWSAGVPNALTNAWFTNNAAAYTVTWTTDATSANVGVMNVGALVNMTELLGNSTWWVTNRYVIGQGANTGAVIHGSGTLVVTNSAGTGQLVLGDAGGKGFLSITNGLVIADRLWASNPPTASLTLNGGELRTLGGGSVVSVSGAGQRISVGQTAGRTTTWVMQQGGTNVMLGTDTYVLQLGLNAGAFGRLIVSDPGTVYTNSGNTAVGSAGRGFIMVSNGAVGYGLALRLGVGGASSTNNEVIITDQNSKWSAGVVSVGYAASGSNVLSVLNGGQLVSSEGDIGCALASTNNTVIVSGANSLWSISGGLWLGGNADTALDGGLNSYLLVSDGGQVTVGTKTKIGHYRASSNSVVRVTGAGSLFRAGSSPLAVGSNTVGSGSGALVLVDDGGTLEANSIMSGLAGSGVISNTGGIYQFTTGGPTITTNTAGSVILSGGTVSFKNVANATLGGDITKILYLGKNTLRLDGATNTAVATYAIGTNAGTTFAGLNLTGNNSLFQNTTLTVDGGGSLSGSGRIGSVNVTNRGVISPGNSPGTLVFASNLTLLSSSSLNIEIGGTNTSLYDHLQVLGSLSLTGALNVSLINGFTPSGSNAFDLLDWGSLFGTFDTVILPVGYDWDTSALYTTGTLSLLAVPEPSAFAAATAGLLLMACLRRRARA